MYVCMHVCMYTHTHSDNTALHCTTLHCIVYAYVYVYERTVHSHFFLCHSHSFSFSLSHSLSLIHSITTAHSDYQQVELEDNILRELTESSGNILDNAILIATLKDAKSKSVSIAEQLVESKVCYELFLVRCWGYFARFNVRK